MIALVVRQHRYRGHHKWVDSFERLERGKTRCRPAKLKGPRNKSSLQCLRVEGEGTCVCMSVCNYMSLLKKHSQPITCFVMTTSCCLTTSSRVALSTSSCCASAKRFLFVSASCCSFRSSSFASASCPLVSFKVPCWPYGGLQCYETTNTEP